MTGAEKKKAATYPKVYSHMMGNPTPDRRKVEMKVNTTPVSNSTGELGDMILQNSTKTKINFNGVPEVGFYLIFFSQ